MTAPVSGAAAKAAPKAAKAVKAPKKTTRPKKTTTDVERVSGAVGAKASKTTTEGKPSIAGHVATGTATGASLGAVLGSVVPGVGTAIGAGVGAGAGAIGGGIAGGRARGAFRRDNRFPGSRVLVAEFVAATVIVGLSPLTDKHKKDTPGDWIKRATGVCALWIVLGMVASIGPRAAKAAAGFGGLVLLVLLVSDRDVFAVIAKRFAAMTPDGPAGPEGDISQGTDNGPPGAPIGSPQQTAPAFPSVGTPQQTAPRPRG